MALGGCYVVGSLLPVAVKAEPAHNNVAVARVYKPRGHQLYYLQLVVGKGELIHECGALRAGKPPAQGGHLYQVQLIGGKRFLLYFLQQRVHLILCKTAAVSAVSPMVAALIALARLRRSLRVGGGVRAVYLIAVVSYHVVAAVKFDGDAERNEPQIFLLGVHPALPGLVETGRAWLAEYLGYLLFAHAPRYGSGVLGPEHRGP